MRLARPDQADRAVQWRQMALVSEAVLTALDAYIAGGGGSRGARALCDPQGAQLPLSRLGPLTRLPLRRPSGRPTATRQIVVRVARASASPATCARSAAATAPRPAYFERDWPSFLSGAIYRA